MLKRTAARVVAWFARERNRAYVYRVLAAAGAPAILYGFVTEQEVAVWLAFAEVGLGLASVNTSTKE